MGYLMDTRGSVPPLLLAGASGDGGSDNLPHPDLESKRRLKPSWKRFVSHLMEHFRRGRLSIQSKSALKVCICRVSDRAHQPSPFIESAASAGAARLLQRQESANLITPAFVRGR